MPQKIETDEFVARKRQGPPRSPEQVEIDNDVAEAWAGSKVLAYEVVGPDGYEAALKQVRSATAYHNVTAVQGEVRQGSRKGTLVLQVKLVDRVYRPRKPKTEG